MTPVSTQSNKMREPTVSTAPHSRILNILGKRSSTNEKVYGTIQHKRMKPVSTQSVKVREEGGGLLCLQPSIESSISWEGEQHKRMTPVSTQSNKVRKASRVYSLLPPKNSQYLGKGSAAQSSTNKWHLFITIRGRRRGRRHAPAKMLVFWSFSLQISKNFRLFVSKINYFTEISTIMENRCEGRNI